LQQTRQQSGPATRNSPPGRIELFEYPAGPDLPSLPAWDGWLGGEEGVAHKAFEARAHEGGGGGAVETRLHGEFEARLAEETRKSFEAGRERGRQEGRQSEQETQSVSRATAEQERARQAAGLVERFAQARECYLQAVEREVVKLALAVAARILRREAQMDPLLLTGAVRVALGQLSGSTQVRLCVPPAELNLWTEAIALLPNLAVKPTVTAGEGMRLGDCVIETRMGSVDLGIRAQLGEIERGFFDRAGSHRTEATESALASSSAEAGQEGRA
jgi:flagellar assembly protein FliH